MTIVNDATSWRVTLELSLTLQESSIMLLENIFSIGITYDDCNMAQVSNSPTCESVNDAKKIL